MIGIPSREQVLEVKGLEAVTSIGSADDGSSSEKGQSLPEVDASSRLLVPEDPNNIKHLPHAMFRPLVLRSWMLCLCLVYHLACLLLVSVVFSISEWKTWDVWTYVLVIILPYVLGTVSTTWLNSIITTLSRITPFLLCASEGGAPAMDTIFQQCFPIPSLWDAGRSRCWFLVLSHGIWWMTIFVMPLKASLMGATENSGLWVTDWEFWVTDWAAKALLGIYASFSVYIIGLLFYLHGRPTGLREDWDTVTIIDHGVLFQHSDFLHLFAGTGGANRDSMMADRRFKDLKVQLRYWRLGVGGEQWYGFGRAQTDPEADGVIGRDKDHGESPKFTREYLDRVCNNSAYAFVDPSSYVCKAVFLSAMVLTTLYITALSIGCTRGNAFPLPMSTDWAEVVLVLIPMTALQIFLSFWRVDRLFAAATQPFVNMRKAGGRPAHDTILLDYVCLSSAEQVMVALKKEHWKVALTGVASMLHRLLPNLAGPSLMITSDETRLGRSMVTLNVPLVAIVSAWLGLELFLIPWAVLTGRKTRYLPRDCLCIADLVSWMCTSGVLHAQGSDNALANALRVPVIGPPEESLREDMVAGLRKSRQHFRFGVVPAEGSPGQFMIGIGLANSEEGTPPVDGQQIPLLGANNFAMAVRREGTVDVGPAEAAIRAEGPHGEERPPGKGEGEEVERVPTE